jgi:hypothetical protein
MDGSIILSSYFTEASNILVNLGFLTEPNLKRGVIQFWLLILQTGSQGCQKTLPRLYYQTTVWGL